MVQIKLYLLYFVTYSVVSDLLELSIQHVVSVS